MCVQNAKQTIGEINETKDEDNIIDICNIIVKHERKII